MPVLSIVMPIYNMAEWLAPALESCLCQSHRDLEILVIDDGSADNGPAIAAAYAGLDSRVRLISQANAGAGAARQRGQDEASGDFVTWMDSDDFLDPRAAAAWLGGAAGGADMVCGNAVAFSSRTFNARRYFSHPPASELRFDGAPRYWKSKVLWRWAFSLPFIRGAGLRHLPFKLGQDVCFMYEALLRAGHFAQVAPQLYYFRQEHKSAHASLETLVEHGFAHFIEVRRILLSPPDGRPRYKPFVKYLNENYWRDIRKAAARLGPDDGHWRARIIELGFTLFDGLDPSWFRAAALAPEVKEQSAFLPFAQAMIDRDRDGLEHMFHMMGQTAPSAPDKGNVFHTLRHRLKSLANPLAYKAKLRLHDLEARAAKRRGVPRPEPLKNAHPGR